MKLLVTICMLFTGLFVTAQTDSARLVTTMKDFHQALVKKNTISINQHTDKALSYGHSNGWVETKTHMIKNLETNYITYNQFKEDSITVSINEGMASVRYIADIDVIMQGHTATYHLKVLEVWAKKGKRWLLFARQATK